MSLKLRVLVFEGLPTLYAGGQERSLYEVVRGLRKQGVAVTLAFEKDGDLVPKYSALGVDIFQIPARQVILKSINAPQSIWKFSVSLWRVVRRWCAAKQKWNLIYVNQYFDLPLAVLSGRILKIPVVCHLRLAAPIYLSRQYRWGLNRCNLLICNSHFTAKTYQKEGISADKMAVIHNAVDTEEYSPASTVESSGVNQRKIRKVLYLGRIAKAKGIEILVDAIALARKIDGRLQLLVVGNNRGDHADTIEYQQELEGYAVQKLGNAVEFRPATPDVVDLYRLTDLVVLPAVWEESFGRVVIEAMACGVPCIASRVGGIPEILSDGFEEMLFEKNNSQELAARILQNVDWRTNNPGLGGRVRKKIVRDFGSDIMLPRLFSVLQGIASNSSGQMD